MGKPREHSEAQDACNLSTAANQYFEAAALSKKCGLKRPEYLQVALGICDFAVSVQQENGKFAKCWNNEGVVIDEEGTIGAYLISPLLKAYDLTGDAKYLLSAQKGYSFYMNEFYQNGYSTAGALDTYCIDKESSIPLIQGGLKLYEATGDSHYLQCVEDASWYAATWQWHHSVSAGHLTVFGKGRPPGGQDEGFCETRWHTSMGQFFGVSQWLVA